MAHIHAKLMAQYAEDAKKPLKIGGNDITKFPNVEVQQHWLAVLEAAAEVLPNCRWVCTAVSLDTEPKTEQEIREVIMQAIAPFNTVDSWLICERDIDPIATRNKAKEYRIAWLNRMIEQCRAMQNTEFSV